MMKTVLLLLALAALPLCVFGDDGSVFHSGGTWQLMQGHPSVRMVREAVDVKILNDREAQVKCTFEFKNEGKATTVKMGFPESAGGDGAPGPDAKRSMLRNFRSSVDGKPAVVTYQNVSKHNGVEEYKGYHIKTVSFAPGQTRTIVDTYTGPVGGDTSGACDFAYILRSGASWKGPIGKAVITVDASALRNKFRIDSTAPPGCKLNGWTLTWTLTNFEPEDDIFGYFATAVDLQINGMPYGSAIYDRVDKVTRIPAFLLENVTDGKLKYSLHGSTCTMKYNGHVLTLTSGSKKAVLDGKAIQLPQPAVLARMPRDNTRNVMVPVAEVVRALGGKAGLTTDEDGNPRLTIHI